MRSGGLYLVSVGPVVPYQVKTITDFFVWCRANPQLSTYGTGGVGTPMHFTGFMLARSAGFEFIHVPYQSSASAVPDLLGGRIATAIVPIDTLTRISNPERFERWRRPAHSEAHFFLTYRPSKRSDIPRLSSSTGWVSSFQQRHQPKRSAISTMQFAKRSRKRKSKLPLHKFPMKSPPPRGPTSPD
jgi:Tripartite tricarboxylate transporter family receptor